MKRIKAFFTRIGNKISALSTRKLVTAIICVLCLLIPSALALTLIFADDSAYIPDSFSVTLYDENHELIASASGAPTDNMSTLIGICHSIFTASEKTDKAPIPPEEGTPIYASVDYNGAPAEYTCYFSFLNGSSYYTDVQGNIFSISADNASAFLSSPYAETLYSKAAPPQLYTNTEAVIIPSSASWYYRLYDDTYREAVNYETTKDALNYEFSGIIDLNFADEPDVCTVRVFENGSLIYEGGKERLASLTVNPNTSLRISVNAKWAENDGVLYHGDVSYSFNAVILDRSEFSIDSDILKKGGFVTLSCTNISDISQIDFTSNHSVSPIFCRDGDTVRALIPYPDDADSDTLTMTLTYGASSRHFSIKLSDTGDGDSYTLSTTPQDISSMSKNSLLEAHALFSDVASKSGDTVYFRGNLLSPEALGLTYVYGFGDSISTTDGKASLTSFGSEYRSSSDGQSIGALCAGKVVAVGSSNSLGNYVAVDHGLGLLTWYCHLSDLNTQIGKTLAIGESVGKTGTGGFSDGDGVLIAVTLGGKPLDLSLIISK